MVKLPEDDPLTSVNIGDYPQSSEDTPTDKSGSSNASIASHVMANGDAADGDDLIQGGPDADWLWGGGGDDILLGGDGDDVLYSYDGDDYLDGGNGNDRLASFGSNDIIRGGDGDDWIDASRDCFVDGGAGYDVLAIEFGNSETPIILMRRVGRPRLDSPSSILKASPLMWPAIRTTCFLVPMQTRHSFRHPLAMMCLRVGAETIRSLIRVIWRVVETITSSAVREMTGFRTMAGRFG